MTSIYRRIVLGFLFVLQNDDFSITDEEKRAFFSLGDNKDFAITAAYYCGIAAGRYSIRRRNKSKSKSVSAPVVSAPQGSHAE